jgi:hypothetical protein
MNFDRIMQVLGGVALLLSLVFIAYELRISNRLAEMEALNRAYKGTAMIRSEMLTYTDVWVKALVVVLCRILKRKESEGFAEGVGVQSS